MLSFLSEGPASNTLDKICFDGNSLPELLKPCLENQVKFFVFLRKIIGFNERKMQNYINNIIYKILFQIELPVKWSEKVSVLTILSY